MILIKGMELPKRCRDCRVYCGQLRYGCPFTPKDEVEDILKQYSGRYKWCPLIEVEPYGAVLYKEKIKQPTVDENQMTWAEYKG